jgi:hypothetical protein
LHDPIKRVGTAVVQSSGADSTEVAPMKALAFYLWRIKVRNQTRLVMYRNRVWYIDNPRAGTVDRWWRA